ncbi:MAG TPA: 4a-hydroxytetrahydrobiopterin dehydratase [Candidatus Paceibacterota bacterium]
MNTNWNEENNTLVKTFTFADFAEALAFVNHVGAIAQELQHHPDISIQNYNTVTTSTTTHDKGNTITEKDHQLIARIDAIIV